MQEIKVLPVRFTENSYRDLKKLAFLKNVPMSEIVRESVEEKIREYKNILTNSDITIS